MSAVAGRGQVDLPCEELNTPRGMIVQGPNIRVGIIPMRYDAANKIASWFWFLAMQVNKKVCASPNTGRVEHQNPTTLLLMICKRTGLVIKG